jgi:hypothetical protein
MGQSGGRKPKVLSKPKVQSRDDYGGAPFDDLLRF